MTRDDDFIDVKITIPPRVTASDFTARVGRAPEGDDLDRANCELAGAIGHYTCGWCEAHDLPRFVCGCVLLPEEVFASATIRRWGPP